MRRKLSEGELQTRVGELGFAVRPTIALERLGLLTLGEVLTAKRSRVEALPQDSLEHIRCCLNAASLEAHWMCANRPE